MLVPHGRMRLWRGALGFAPLSLALGFVRDRLF
jgi:hypothetical protein